MRIWDLPVQCLCRNHLLAEHRELHAIWSVIVNNKRGYSHHPEVMRWRGKLRALLSRHEDEVSEMGARGYKHRSPLSVSDVPCGHEGALQSCLLEPREEQARKLKLKGCECDPPRT